jgi:hypothetical protein
MSAEQERLRKEIDKAYKAVTNKINRTRRQKGAEVAGSKFDPRKDASAHNRMRSPERMQAYLDRLNNFMSRSNQFYAGAGGAPLRAGYFNRAYKPTERQLDAVQNKRDAELSSVKSPTGFAIKDLSTALPKAGGHGRFGPYKRFDRSPGDIASDDAMVALTKQMRDQLNPDYLHNELDNERDRLRKVTEYLGEKATDLADKIEKMDDYEFDLFWFGTNVASGIFLFYELEKERNEGTHKEKRQDRAIESKFKEAEPAADWAIEEGRKKREAEVNTQMGNLQKQNRRRGK